MRCANNFACSTPNRVRDGSPPDVLCPCLATYIRLKSRESEKLSAFEKTPTYARIIKNTKIFAAFMLLMTTLTDKCFNLQRRLKNYEPICSARRAQLGAPCLYPLKVLRKERSMRKKLPPQIRAIFGTAAYIKSNNAFLRRMRC